jgi:hypothetical protein
MHQGIYSERTRLLLLSHNLTPGQGGVARDAWSQQ